MSAFLVDREVPNRICGEVRIAHKCQESYLYSEPGIRPQLTEYTYDIFTKAQIPKPVIPGHQGRIQRLNKGCWKLPYTFSKAQPNARINSCLNCGKFNEQIRMLAE